MQQRQKGEYEKSLLGDLEVEGDLALLLVHTLVGQPAKVCFVGGVIGVDGHADASGDRMGLAVDADRLAKGACNADRAGVGNDVYGLVAGQVSGNDNELVAAEAGERVRGTDGAAEVVPDVAE